MSAPLPPQAYTRETLSQAFLWLQTQPEHVRKMALSPDHLVALYTRSKRYGDGLEASGEIPKASTEVFRSHLKSLASELQNFSPIAPVDHEVRSQSPTPPTSFLHQPEETDRFVPPPTLQLDSKSSQLVELVKEGLGLTVDSEVVKMLIHLGYQKLRPLVEDGNTK
ncbi:MAG: hypothetical protein COT74_09055 [Bdellovibrionales bacterium CG10_big_fil_rev_8_21_14_0_10_45_34]|nr:MAG: hypothetical protein COT74_09055 [Bdellovibrionales bacterium CG10_big_fil_rev_8_21_14_0_10_45_34]